MALPVLGSGRSSAPAPGGCSVDQQGPARSWPWASRAAHCDPLLPRKEKTSGSTAFLRLCGVRGAVGVGPSLPGRIPAHSPAFLDEPPRSRRPGGVVLEPERGRGPARPLPPAACAGAEGSSGAAPPPPGSPAGMLRLGRGLRRLVPGRGARASAGLPLGAEMPKKAGATNKGKSPEPERPPPSLGPVTVDPRGGVTIAIRAKPGSKQNAVTDVTAEAVSVAIAAPASEGEANAELCRYLSKVLELRKSDVVLDKGGKSREKVVKLLASTTAEEILEKLKQQVEKK